MKPHMIVYGLYITLSVALVFVWGLFALMDYWGGVWLFYDPYENTFDKVEMSFLVVNLGMHLATVVYALMRRKP
jgi:hypothetical protein